MQYLCLTCSESYDKATDRRANAKWFLTQLAKVGLPFPLSLRKPTDNKWINGCSKPPLWGWNWRGDFICRDIGLLLSSYVSSSTSSAAFPRGRSLPLFIGGTKWHFPGTEWQRDRKARQNVWDPLLKTNLTKYLKFHGINRTCE